MKYWIKNSDLNKIYEFNVENHVLPLESLLKSFSYRFECQDSDGDYEEFFEILLEDGTRKYAKAEYYGWYDLDYGGRLYNIVYSNTPFEYQNIMMDPRRDWLKLKDGKWPPPYSFSDYVSKNVYDGIRVLSEKEYEKHKNNLETIKHNKWIEFQKQMPA